MRAGKWLKLWLRQTGCLKKLQLFLLISFLLNALLILQVISLNGKFSQYQQTQPQKQDSSQPIPQAKSQITEQELQDFCKLYLESFFATDNGSYATIEQNSSTKLFEESLKAQILSRQKQKIQSQIKISYIHLESLDAEHARATSFILEDFVDSSYQDREFRIALIINVANLRVEAIPVFKLEGK